MKDLCHYLISKVITINTTDVTTPDMMVSNSVFVDFFIS